MHLTLCKRPGELQPATLARGNPQIVRAAAASASAVALRPPECAR